MQILVIHALKEKINGTYLPAFIEGSIYDKNGEVCIVPNRMFHDGDIDIMNEWLDEHQEEWLHAIEE